MICTIKVLAAICGKVFLTRFRVFTCKRRVFVFNLEFRFPTLRDHICQSQMIRSPISLRASLCPLSNCCRSPRRPQLLTGISTFLPSSLSASAPLNLTITPAPKSRMSTATRPTTSPFTRAAVDVLKRLYPPELADSSFDNTGLLLEAPENPQRPKKNEVLLTIDLTEKVADEANERGCSLIMSYRESFSSRAGRRKE